MLRELTEKFQRDALTQLLQQCTSDQQEFFARIYPKGVPPDKIEAAYGLVERTIRKNHAGRVS
jgi:hypothetical protein